MMNARQMLMIMTVAVWTGGCADSPTAPSPAPPGAVADHAVASLAKRPGGPGPGSGLSIKVVQGTIIIDFDPSGLVSLRGTRGFTFHARLGDGRFPGEECRAIFCEPGSDISLHGLWVHPDLRGTLVIQGQDLTDEEDLDSPAVAVEVSGTFTAPPQAATATVTAPFTLSGTFSSDAASGTIEGRGVATVSLEWVDAGWVVSRVQYEIRGQSRR